MVMFKMPVFYVPFTFQEQLDIIRRLKKLGLSTEDQARLDLMKMNLNDFGFLTDEETNYLQNILDEEGWKLD